MRLKHQSGFLRPLLLLASGILGLALAAGVIISLFRIPIDLAPYKPMAESALGKALGRQVKIEGDITVTTSLWPYFEIEGLRIANPGGFTHGDLASMELARVTVGLLPLLKRKVRIREFRVNALTLDLERSAQGDANWVLEGVAPAEDVTQDTPSPESEPGTLASDVLVVDELSLEDIHVSFRDAGAEPLEFIMDRAEGAAAAGEPMSLSMQGQLLEEAFTIQVEASSLGDFLAMSHSRLGLQLDIAGTAFAFTGLSEALRGGHSSELQLVVKGANLSSLNDLLQLDLPPLKDYRVQADMRALPGRLELSSLEASVKGSKLHGNVVVDKTGKRPFATADFSAKSIQLQDFDTGDWTAESAPSPDSPAAAPGATSAGEKNPESAAAGAKILSPEALQRADARLTIKVDQVLSGNDKLGSGELELTLKNGRIQLDPLQLQLPQASLLVQASLKPGPVASDAALRVLVENFDFGVLTRLSDPNSEVGGTLNVDLDVTASASNTNIMSGANGYFDISGQPENFRSNLIDLWAVNLLSAVVSSSSEEDISQINCLISRFRISNGVMTSEQLAADTSKIRICGEGEVRFTDRNFNLVVTPNAKRPEFFSLAAPLAVKGEFDDFSIGMRAGVLTLSNTAVKFVASPITTPVKRLFKDDLPEDGADICALPIGPRAQALEPLPGC